MISVCIATFNGERFILRQIKSILSQLAPNDEIIISDDNSTDSTLSIIESIKDSRIHIYKNHLSKVGPLNNFNNALSKATGNYIFLSDQDDVWEENKVKATLIYLAEYDLVLSDCTVVGRDMQTLVPSFFALRNVRKGFLNNLYKNSYIGCCMAFNSKILNDAMPIPSQVHMHDWWIGMVAEMKYKVFFLRTPLIKYVRHGSNASQTAEQSKYTLVEKLSNRLVLLFFLLTRVKI